MHSVADLATMKQRDDDKQSCNNATIPSNMSALPSKYIFSRRTLGGMGHLMDLGAPSLVAPLYWNPKSVAFYPPHTTFDAPRTYKAFETIWCTRGGSIGPFQCYHDDETI